jgi:hypothetical protein
MTENFKKQQAESERQRKALEQEIAMFKKEKE